jgi:hypothetical protein
MPEPEWLLGHGETAPSASEGPAALQGRALKGAWRRLGVRQGRQSRVTVDGRLFFYARAVTLRSSTWRRVRLCCPGKIFPPARRACGRGERPKQEKLEIWSALPKGLLVL